MNIDPRLRDDAGDEPGEVGEARQRVCHRSLLLAPA